MREIRLGTEREHQRFLEVMERKMDEYEMGNKELAEALGVAVSSIYNFRADRSRNPSRFLAGKIATYLDIRPGDYRRMI